MIGLDILLSAALKAGLGVLDKAGFGDEVRALKERLTEKNKEARQVAFDRAFNQAVEEAGDDELRFLVEQEPFREAVIAGLLDLELGPPCKGGRVRSPRGCGGGSGQFSPRWEPPDGGVRGGRNRRSGNPVDFLWQAENRRHKGSCQRIEGAD